MSTPSHLAIPPQRRRLHVSIVLAAFSVAFVIALFLDVPLSTYAHEAGLAGWLKDHPNRADVIRLPGNFLFTIAICAALLTAAWRAGIRIAMLAFAFVMALFLYIPLSPWAHDSGMAGSLKDHPYIADVIRHTANFLFTFVICELFLIDAWRAGIRRGPQLWERPAIVFLAGVLSSLNDLLKMFVGRIRPYHGVPPFELHPFRYGLVNAEASYSFPSGDATLAFAMAVSLGMVLPRFRPLWWTLAVIVALERIAANAHYPSDVVAGAALGTAVAVAAKKIVRVLTKKDANPPGEIMIQS